MKHRLVAVLLVAALTVPTPVDLAQAPQPDFDLDKGIRETREGNFDAAIITLDGVARRLSAQGGRPKELARAYTYLAIAYLGLSQEQTAKAKFLEAWKTDHDLDLTAREFPPKIVEFFQSVLNEIRAVATPSPPPSPSPSPAQARSGTPVLATKGSSSKLPLVLAGIAVVAGAAALAGAGSSPTSASSSPTPAPTPTPIPATIDLRLNGAKTGTFSCSAGLFFTINLINHTSQGLRIDGLTMSLTSLSPECTSNAPPASGTPVTQVAPGANAELRRIDLAGALCDPPFGRPACQWRASSTVTTGLGSFSDQIDFSTSR